MKNMPDLASISGVHKHLLSRQWFYTVTRTFLQIELANMHGWIIFLIKAASMLASTQIKMVNPPDKKPGISNMGRLFCVFVALISICLPETVLQHSSDRATSKACWLMWFMLKIPKILCVFAQNVACKFTLALGLKTIPERKVAIIGVSNGQTGFMPPLLQNTSCQSEINSFPSFDGPKWWRSKMTQKLSWANRYYEVCVL